MKFKGFFDGSSKPNPGIMTIGGVIKDKSNTVIIKYSEELDYGTNNQSEYLSLKRLLDEAIKADIKSIEIFGDSALVVNQVNGKWKVKDSKLLILCNQVRYKLKHYFTEWKLEHVKRGFNKEADLLTR